MMVQVYTTRETSFLNLQIIYTIRSEDNWKIFSSKWGPPYPSRRIHPSYGSGSG
jgi:hypothetical protein